MSLLRATGIEAGVGSVTACRNLNLTLKPGEIWSVLGRNGVGKTTLLLTLAGLIPLWDGEIELGGESLYRLSRRERAQRLGILFQHSETLFSTRVIDAVMTGRHPWVSGWRGTSHQDEEIVQEELHRVGLERFSERMVTTLSGGERRRMEIAALCAQQTPVVLLDEPVNHLDLHYQVDLMGAMLKEWQRKGCAVMMVMHDLNLALRFSNRLLLMFGESETLQGTVNDLATEENLSRLYQHEFQRYWVAEKPLFYPL